MPKLAFVSMGLGLLSFFLVSAFVRGIVWVIEGFKSGPQD
jgi:hypothetical protein